MDDYDEEPSICSSDEDRLFSQIYYTSNPLPDTVYSYENEEKHSESEDDILINIINDDKESGELEEENSSDEFLESDDDQDKKRYFGDGPTCFNCGQSGHVMKECPEELTMPCFVCGMKGHERNECPMEVCYNCRKNGHISKKCPEPRHRRIYLHDRCQMCDLMGHHEQDCPLEWRVYKMSHLPSRGSFKNLIEKNIRPRCYACSSSEHFGDTCEKRNKNNFVSAFHIPSYFYVQNADINSLQSTDANFETPVRSGEKYNTKSEYIERNRRDRVAPRSEYKMKNSYNSNYSSPSARAYQNYDRNYQQQPVYYPPQQLPHVPYFPRSNDYMPQNYGHPHMPYGYGLENRFYPPPNDRRPHDAYGGMPGNPYVDSPQYARQDEVQRNVTYEESQDDGYRNNSVNNNSYHVKKNGNKFGPRYQGSYRK